MSLKPFLITSAPWDYFFLYPVTNAQHSVCFPQWSTWVTRVCYKHAMSCYPFGSDQYFLFMPVPAWEAFPSLSSSIGSLLCQALSALWARYPPLCSYHSLYIHLFQHCCLGPTWNILYFIPYKPVHFLKQLLHFIYSSAKNYAWYRPDVQYVWGGGGELQWSLVQSLSGYLIYTCYIHFPSLCCPEEEQGHPTKLLRCQVR